MAKYDQGSSDKSYGAHTWKDGECSFRICGLVWTGKGEVRGGEGRGCYDEERFCPLMFVEEIKFGDITSEETRARFESSLVWYAGIWYGVRKC